jgi:hypothetical protein
MMKTQNFTESRYFINASRNFIQGTEEAIRPLGIF